MERLGLNENQIILLTEALNKEAKLRRLMEMEHITHAESVLKVLDVEELDLSNEDLIREKLKAEFGEFIPKQYRSLTSGVS